MNQKLQSEQILSISGLLSFWEFQEPAGQDRVARGAFPARLIEGGKPVRQAEDGFFGPHAALFEPGAWLRLPSDLIGPLNRYGQDGQVTVVAWIKRRQQTPEWCDFIAGLWNERQQRRQYGLFLGLGLQGVEPHRQICGHISASGGPSEGLTFCDEAASGNTPMDYDTWVMVGMTYDGEHIRAYHQGILDSCGDRNPYHYPFGIHEGGTGGADFTVGAVALPTDTRDPRMNHENNMGCWYSGLMGGLAVFERALQDKEMLSLAI